MNDGKHTFYVLQERIIAHTVHRDPNGPMIPQTDQYADWHYSSHDQYAEPRNWKRGVLTPRCKASSAERDDLFQVTSFKWVGWWSLRYAIKGLRRVLKAYEEGKFHHTDYSSIITTKLKMEFRIVKMTISQLTEPVDMTEIILSL